MVKLEEYHIAWEMGNEYVTKNKWKESKRDRGEEGDAIDADATGEESFLP